MVTEISVEVDGELLGETPLEFSILHKAVRIVAFTFSGVWA